MNYEEKYKQALERAKYLKENTDSVVALDISANFEYIFPELKESEDEKIRKEIIQSIQDNMCVIHKDKCIAWLEKQGEQKEINLVEILKHYPRETELYSPLYGKLWLAEVNEEHGIITCYKYPLEEGCTRAILEQEDTVSFYSNGSTGLPDFNVSKDCMLFLHNNEKQGEQNPAWSEEDEERIEFLIAMCDDEQAKCRNNSTMYRECTETKDWLKSLKDRVQPQPKQEWSEYDEIQLSEAIQMIEANGTWIRSEDAVKKVSNWLKSINPKHWKPSEEQMQALKKRTYGLHNDSDIRKALESLIGDLTKL